MPQETLAVVLGASWFEHAPTLAQGKAFTNSAQEFRDYLLSADGLALPRPNLKYLFDEGKSSHDQLLAIGDFLARRISELKKEGSQAKGLIVYYVGHGLFSGSDNAYFFAIRSTDIDRPGVTSLRVSELASVIKDQARLLNRFLILDCCFAAAASAEFQSAAVQASRRKLEMEFPRRGTAMLCSASSHDPALAPVGMDHTLFSDSLLRVLTRGDAYLKSHLSLSDLGSLVKQDINDNFAKYQARPEVHSPDQREGDIADVPLFPNKAANAVEAGEAPPVIEPPKEVISPKKVELRPPGAEASARACDAAIGVGTDPPKKKKRRRLLRILLWLVLIYVVICVMVAITSNRSSGSSSTYLVPGDGPGSGLPARDGNHIPGPPGGAKHGSHNSH